MSIKKVFFAEDRPESIEGFISVLEAHEIEHDYEETWEDIFTYIEKNKTTLPDIIVIDMNIPVIHPNLKTYANKELRGARDLNQGQAFGLWLTDTYPQIPYVYLTHMPSVFNPDASDYQRLREDFEPNQFIFSKSVTPEHFYEMLNSFYNAFKENTSVTT